jgi:hypothetical protein
LARKSLAPMEAVKAHAVVGPGETVTVTGLPFGEG